MRFTDPTGHFITEEEDCTQLSCSKDPDNEERRARIRSRQVRETAAQGLGTVALGADALAFFISFGEAAVADFFYGATAFLSVVQPEGAPSLLAAYQIDKFLAGPLNPGGSFENALGWLGFGATAGADLLSGNTTSTAVGRDTLVAGRNMGLGLVPASNWDFAVRASQLKYDVDRLNGALPGGSVPLTDLGGLAIQVFWDDTPWQHALSGLGIVH
jgi:hypothetical protein